MKISKGLFTVLTVLVLLLLSIPTKGVTFELKLGGGINYMFLTEYNHYIDGWNIYMDYHNTKPGSFKNLHWGLDLAGEFILYFTPNLGIGLGGGYQYIGITFDEAEYNPIFPVISTINKEISLAVIPVQLSLHYKIPLTSFMNLQLGAG